MTEFTPHNIDDDGLLRNEQNKILAFRAISSDPERPNALRKHPLRTNFHGIDGIYAGNVPESVSGFAPRMVVFSLDHDTEIVDNYDISNVRWGLRALARIIKRQHELDQPKAVTIVRPSVKRAELASSLVYSANTQPIRLFWLILPLEMYQNANKQDLE